MADQSKTGGGGFKGYIPVAAALFIGVIVGGFLFAGEDVGEAIEQRVAATEAEFADQLGAARGEMDEQLTALSQRAEEIGQEIGRLDPIEQGQEALRAAGEEIGQRIETLEASMGERFGTHETRFAEHDERLTAQEEAGERVEALESRLQTMAEQMARLVTRLQEVESSGSAVAALGAPATGAGAAPAPSGEPAAQERREQPQPQQQEPAQEQEQEQPQARQAQQSQAQPQTETFRLGFGEVGELAGVRVFVSRLDEAAGEIGLLTPGRGAQTVSESAPLDLGDGCSVRLDGFEDGLAVLNRRCETTQADAASTGAGGRQAQLTIGESVTLGGRQLALVRTDSEIGMAAVRVDDRRTVRIVPEWPASLGTDCSVRLVEVSEDAATLAATGDCGGEAQEESAAQQQPAAAQTAAAPEPEAQPQTQAAQDESPADTISAPTAAVQPEGQSQTAAETAAEAEAVQPAVAAARAGAQPAEAVTPPAPAEAEAGAEQAAVEPEAGATPAAAPAGGGDETVGESIELRSGETATIGGHSVELLRVEAESEYIAVRVDERRTVRVTPFWPASLERNCVVRLVEMTEDAATLQVQGDCAG